VPAFPCSQNKNSLLSLLREFRYNILNLQADSTPNLLLRTQNLQNSLQISLFDPCLAVSFITGGAGFIGSVVRHAVGNLWSTS
jgi:hypothetical protein